MKKNLKLFTHNYIDNNNAKTFLLLHGSGGDENEIMPLAMAVDSTYSVLSLRGNIKEHGMNRFFERYTDGSFNIKSIVSEREKLDIFLTSWLEAQNKTFEDLILMGYSNGANFGLSYIMRYSNKIKQALLLHPTLPYTENSVVNLDGVCILVTTGKNDPYLIDSEKIELKELLKGARAQFVFYQHEGGHELVESEIKQSQEFLQKIPLL